MACLIIALDRCSGSFCALGEEAEGSSSRLCLSERLERDHNGADVIEPRWGWTMPPPDDRLVFAGRESSNRGIRNHDLLARCEGGTERDIDAGGPVDKRRGFAFIDEVECSGGRRRGRGYRR